MLTQDFNNPEKAAAQAFLHQDDQQQVSLQNEQLPEQTLSPEAVDSLINAHLQAKERYNSFLESDSLTEAQKKELNDLYSKQLNASITLSNAYERMPNKEYRAKTLSSLYPELKDYSSEISELKNTKVIYQLFVFRINDLIETIDGIRSNQGEVDPGKLRTKIEQAVAAVSFVENDAQGQGLVTLAQRRIIDIFNHPEAVAKWQPFIISLTSEHQAKLFYNIIRKNPPENPEELQKWVQATKWVDSQEKVQLLGHAFRNLDDLCYWKEAIEHICEKVPIIDPNTGQIEMGVPQEQFRAIEQFIYINRSPDKVIQEWDRLNMKTMEK